MDSEGSDLLYYSRYFAVFIRDYLYKNRRGPGDHSTRASRCASSRILTTVAGDAPFMLELPEDHADTLRAPPTVAGQPVRLLHPLVVADFDGDPAPSERLDRQQLLDDEPAPL